MDYQASLTHFEEAKVLISPRAGYFFILMRYKQHTNAIICDEIGVLAFLLNFSEDFEKKYGEEKNCEN